MTSLTHYIVGLEKCRKGDLIELSAFTTHGRAEPEIWEGPAIYLGLEPDIDGEAASFLCDCGWWNPDIKIVRVVAHIQDE